MIELSENTEAIARQLAAAKGIPVDEVVRMALQSSVLVPDFLGNKQRDSSPEAIASRRACIDQIRHDIASMPILDPRSPQEIMDDINRL